MNDIVLTNSDYRQLILWHISIVPDLRPEAEAAQRLNGTPESRRRDWRTFWQADQERDPMPDYWEQPAELLKRYPDPMREPKSSSPYWLILPPLGFTLVCLLAYLVKECV